MTRVKGYTFRGSNSFLFSFLKLWLTVEERICSLRGKFFSLKSRPQMRKVSLSREAHGKPQKLCPFIKNCGKTWRSTHAHIYAVPKYTIIKLARSPASRLAGDFLVSCQPAVTSTKVSCQPAGRRPKSLLPASYWNTNK